MNEIVISIKEEKIPSLPTMVIPAINELIKYLKIPREVLASDEEISYAWQDLSRELKNIPVDLRGELIARMCVAVSAGLFDGAMNYIWNAAIIKLRDKLKIFGLPIIANILEKDFEEKNLVELQDSKLLELCLKINIIDEDGFFFLDQCRNIRNNFSAAHPTIGNVNDREFIVFLNRCVKYALADSSSPKGVNINEFINAMKSTRFIDEQLRVWCDRLKHTHSAQLQMLIIMTHSLYCDSSSQESVRLNCLDICKNLKSIFNSSIESSLINKHNEYTANGKEDKNKASLQFFEKLNLINLLDESEKHGIFSKATTNLWDVHNAMNNFYNEPPFAERLYELTLNTAVPETIQENFVNVVICCRLGNGYGVCSEAQIYYDEIIKNFSPREITIFIKLSLTANSSIFNQLRNSNSKRNLKNILTNFDKNSIPETVKADFEKLSDSSI